VTKKKKFYKIWHFVDAVAPLLSSAATLTPSGGDAGTQWGRRTVWNSRDNSATWTWFNQRIKQTDFFSSFFNL